MEMRTVCLYNNMEIRRKIMTYLWENKQLYID